MRKTISAILLTLLASSVALGQSGSHNKYKWKDAQGGVHFADTLPPEAVQFGYDVVSAQGIVVKHVDRAKTPDELQQTQAENARKQQADHQAEMQKNDDEQMLAAYANADELAKAQKGQIEAIEQSIRSAQTGVATEENTLAEYLARAGEFEHSNQAVPQTLTQHIADLRKSMNEHNAFIDRRKAEIGEMVTRNQARLEHYQALIKAAKDNH